MDLRRAERALMQVKRFFEEASITSYRFVMLESRSPASQREAYRIGFEGLVKNGLLVQYPREQLFGISSAGLKAMV